MITTTVEPIPISPVVAAIATLLSIYVLFVCEDNKSDIWISIIIFACLAICWQTYDTPLVGSHIGQVQSDCVTEVKEPHYSGKKYSYFRFDSRLETVDDLSSFKPNRAAKRRSKQKSRNTRVLERSAKIQAKLDVQSMDGLCAQLDSMKAHVAGLGDCDFIIKLVEDATILAYGISRARNRTDITVAITTFAKLCTSKSLTSSIASKLLHLKLDNLFQDESRVQSADSPFSTMRQLLDNYEHARELPLFKKLYKFSMYALSMSLFEKVGVTFDTLCYSKVEEAYIREKFTRGPDFVHCLLDTTLFVCERGFQAYKAGSVQPLFHGGGSYDKWCDDARLLKEQALFLSNPEAQHFTLFDFLARLDDAIDKGEAIVRYIRNSLGSKDRSVSLYLQRLLEELRLIRANEMTKRSARMGRASPFAILVYGGSSIGKSTFKDILFNHFGKTTDLPVDPEYMYTRVFTDPFWSGFRTSQWCILLDDIGFRKAGYAQGDASLDEMLQIINFCAFTPPQADLPDKGRIPLQCRCVIGTTNAEHLNAYAYFHNALAVRRRMPNVVEITPKACYTSDGVTIDATKVPELAPGEYPNFWTIELKKVIPSGTNVSTQDATTETVRKYEDINEFLADYSRLIVAHEETQKIIMSSNKSLRSMRICKTCYYAETKCLCTTPVFSDFVSPPLLEVQTSDFFDIAQRNETIHLAESGVTGAIAYVWFVTLIVILELCLYCTKYGFFVGNFFTYLMSTRIFNTLVMYLSRRIAGQFGVHLRRRFVRYLGDRTAFLMETPPKVITFVKCLVAFIGAYKAYQFGKNLGASVSSFFSTKSEDEPEMENSASFGPWPSSSGKPSFAPWKSYEEMTLSQLVTPQGNIQSKSRLSETIGVRPQPVGEQKESVWMKNDYVTTHEDVNPLTIGWNSMEHTQVLSKLRSNCCTFITRRFCEEDGQFRVRNNRAVCVGGQVYMTNNHGLPPVGNLDLRVVFAPGKDGITPNLNLVIEQGDIHRFPEKDLAFIELRDLPPHKNIVGLFPNEALQGAYKGTYLAVDENGITRKFDLSVLGRHMVRVDDCRSGKFGRDYDMWQGIVDRDTVSGDCGSLMVASTRYGPTILGIHLLGGHANHIAALAVSRQDVANGVKCFGTLHVQNGPPTLSAPGCERALVDLHRKASVRYIPSGSAKVYGSFSGMRAAHKSSVVQTKICPNVVQRGYSIKTGPPVMRGWLPWHLALKDMVQPACNIRRSVLDNCVKSFSEEILESLPQEELSKLVILDNLTALNGAPGVTFIDKMNRNTSMGNPWKRSKKGFLMHLEDTSIWQDGVMFTDDVMDRVDDIIRRYQSGVRTKPNFCGHLKDEPVVFRKIEAGKTRVFTGGPADWSLVVRKYLLSFVRVVQDNRYVFEAGPGTICQSLEWEEMFEFLTHFGPDNMVAGDYGKFDKKMSASMILAAYDVIINIHRAAGWSEGDLLILKGIAVDTAFPLIDFNGELIEFYGSNPSGHPLTVVINSIANALYLRYVFSVLKEKEEAVDVNVRNFKEHVKLMTYGDDNVFGVSPKVPWFNHTAIKDQLAIIGVEYTMADKDSASVPFISINDIAFLKRRWRWDSDVGAYLSPLEHDSIEKMLTMCVRSNTICAEAQAVDTIESALNEYFYYGRDIFEDKRKMLQEVILEAEITHFVRESTLPTWDHLYDRFWAASEGVTLGKYTSSLSRSERNEERRTPSRRGVKPKPTEALSGSYCSTPMDNGEERMDQEGTTPERPSDTVFTEVSGVGTSMSKEESSFGELGSGIQPPTNQQNQESTDYKMQNLNLNVQSADNYDGLLDLTDAELGRLMRSTWMPGQYVKYKRFLWREHQRTRTILARLTPDEQMRLIRQLETLMEERNGDHGEVQSGDIPDGATLTVAQNLTFADGESGPGKIMESHLGATYDGDMDDAAQLGNFLSRPVIINTFTWPESSSTLFHTNFNPWQVYFSDAKVAKKLDNFSRLHCRLKLKFVINASPFYYGAMRVVYSPLSSPVYGTQANDQIIYSQRPGVWLEPQQMTTVEMELPFLTPANWIDTNLAANFGAMGRIDYVQYAKLRSANSVIGSGITITCYAWAEDVTLSGPTTALSVQSDEYVENATISGPATAVAGVAARLTDVPVIGDLARATEIGARAVAGMAKLFGFSNPPVISDVGAVQPKSFHAMANVDTCVPLDKLALDSKNEITISNTVAGTDSEDTLALSNLVTRESFLIGALWSGADAQNTLLLSWIVTPNPVITTGVAPNTYKYYTPLSYFTQLFAQWRGSIHYKIKFVKTQYHRGRVVVSWDPNALITLTSDTDTTCYSRIVDLEHEDEIDFIVPYKATTPWLSAAPYSSALSNATVPGFTLDKTMANGVVTVRVLNVITGPAASPQIDLLLFSKAGPDYMMSVPTQLPLGTAYSVQSTDTVSHEGVEIDTYVCGITVGESIASLRPLLHRSVYWATQEVGNYLTAAGTYQGAGLVYSTNLLPKFPLAYGYSATGINWASDGATNRRVNFCNNHPIDWVLNAFVGVRGSTVMHINVHSESSTSSLCTGLSAERHYANIAVTFTNQNINRRSLSVAFGTGPSTLANLSYLTAAGISYKPGGSKGMSLTNQRTQTALSVVVPQYNSSRFKLAPADQRVSADYENVRIDTTFKQYVAGSATVPWPTMDIYYAAGVDFNPVFFLSTPRLYTYSSAPVPVDTYTP